MKCITQSLLILSLSTHLYSQAQPPSPNALDFWIGEWEASWQGENGETQTGTNTIKRILGGKVIQEDFDARESLDFSGRSHSVLDSLTGKWKQTWVDSNGSYMDFEGHQEGETFVFGRSFTNPDGEYRESRMIFHSIKPNSFIWDWQGRRDADGEWKLLWQISYKRLN